jgi:DNA helicase-2/ATP-dependent DNA helicase PcrA
LEQECAFIAETIKYGVKELNRQYSDFAILLRTNSQSDLILPALNSREIPFHVAEARGLLLRPEVRDVIAYLKTVFNPEDAVSLFRILSLDIFDIEPYERQKLLSESRQENETLISFLKKISEREGFSDQTKLVVEKIIEQLGAHVARATTATPSRIALEFLHNSGYLNLAKKRVEKSPEVLPNLSEFVQFVLQYEKSDPQSSLMSFLDYLDLVISSGESPAQAALGHDFDAVRVMTVHGAKG